MQSVGLRKLQSYRVDPRAGRCPGCGVKHQMHVICTFSRAGTCYACRYHSSLLLVFRFSKHLLLVALLLTKRHPHGEVSRATQRSLILRSISVPDIAQPQQHTYMPSIFT